MNRIIVAGLLASALSVGIAQAAQEGLVNVKVGNVSALNDIGIAEGTSIQVPIGIAAQVCPGVDANVLAKQKEGAVVDCTVTQDSANEAFINFAKNHKTTQ
jgi:hypothetical protein